MARLQLSDVISRVRDEIPNKEQAPLVRALNDVIRKLHTELVAPTWSTFTTKAITTTGTVALTEGDTGLTFSASVVLTTDPVRLGRFGDNAALFIVTRGAADTLGDLSSKWPDATAAAATYTLMYPTITFGSGVGEILEIKNATGEPLRFDALAKIPEAHGIPTHWSPYVMDESTVSPDDDQVRIIISPAPTAAEVFTYQYRRRTTEIDPGGATTQTVPFTDLWNEAVMAGLMSHLWRQESQDRAREELARFEHELSKALGAAHPAAVIRPRQTATGVWGVEDRPVTSG